MKRSFLVFFLTLFTFALCHAEGDTLGVYLPDADELHILSTDESVPEGAKDSYLRIVLDRKVEAGKWTMIVFPMALDGYYFGSGAERYKVKSCDFTTDPVTMYVDGMDDLDDFLPYQTYMVKSRSDMEQLVAMFPGLETKVEKSSEVSLACLTFDNVHFVGDGIENISATDLSDARQVYDLSGRLAKTVESGIVIINGKKVFEK